MFVEIVLKLDNSTQEQNDCRSVLLGRLSTGYQVYAMVMLVFTLSFLFVSLLYWAKHNKRTHLVMRSKNKLLLLSTFVIAQCFSGTLQTSSSSQPNVINSCFFRYFFSYLAVLSFLSFVFLRTFMFQIRFHLYEEVQKLYQLTAKEVGNQPSVDDSLSTSHTKRLGLLFHLSTVSFDFKAIISLFLMSNALSAGLATVSCPDENDVADEGCDLAGQENASVVFALVVGIFLALFIVYVLMRTRTFPDPFKIMKEVAVLAITYIIAAISVVLVYSLNRSDIEESSKELNYSPEIILDFYAVFIVLYSITFQVHLSGHDQFQKLTVNATLFDVIRNPVTRRLFKQHLEVELSAENLAFYLNASQWRDSYDTTFDETRQKVALNIIRRWLSPDSRQEVSISYEVRKDLEAELELAKQGSGNYPKTLFDPIINEVFRLMASDSFHRFKLGPMYKLYLGMAMKSNDLEGIAENLALTVNTRNTSTLNFPTQTRPSASTV